jgi:uncharacterized membrane protein YfcA
MSSSTFGKLWIVAFCLGYFVNHLTPDIVAGIYNFALLVGIVHYFFMRSREKKTPQTPKTPKVTPSAAPPKDIKDAW